MTDTASTRVIVELPLRVRHYQTQGLCEDWATWDQLLAEDGFEEHAWYVDPDTNRKVEWPEMHPGPLRKHQHLEARINGHRIVVFPPALARETTA